MSEQVETQDVQTGAQGQTGLYKKLVAVMAQIERVPKNGHNDHFNYNFATNEDVLDTVRGLLADQGIALLVSAAPPERHDNKTLLPVTFTLIDSDTGQSKEFTWTGEADDRQDKGINKAATAAQKYWLLKQFMISTGDLAADPDASLSGAPEWLRTPEALTNLFYWVYVEKGMTKEQLVEAVGHPAAFRDERRVFVALVNEYLNGHES